MPNATTLRWALVGVTLYLFAGAWAVLGLLGHLPLPGWAPAS